MKVRSFGIRYYAAPGDGALIMRQDCSSSDNESTEVIDLADALDYLTELLDDIASDERQLTMLEQQLAYSLTRIRDTIQPALNQAAEELVEIGRDVSQYDKNAPKPKFTE